MSKFEDGFLLDIKVDLFDNEAKYWAEKINYKDRSNRDKFNSSDRMNTTQFRKFYDKVLELNEKSIGLNKEEFQRKILPFVKMLNSKVAYAKERKLAGKNFEILMSHCIKNVNSQNELQNFKYFLEAIIGFMPKN